VSRIPADIKEQVKKQFDEIDMFSEEKEEEIKDYYAELSDEELAEMEEKFQEEQLLDDIDNYFNDNEQIELIEHGIKLTTAKKYFIETNKKPIWRGNTTKKFKSWLESNSSEEIDYLKENDNEIMEAIQQVKEYEQLLFLYNLMSEKMEFTIPPTEDEIIKIENIKKLLEGVKS